MWSRSDSSMSGGPPTQTAMNAELQSQTIEAVLNKRSHLRSHISVATLITLRRYGDEESFAPHDSRNLSCCLDLRRAGSLGLRRFLGPSLRDAERCVRSDL